MTLLVLAILTPVAPLAALCLFASSRPRNWHRWFVNLITAVSIVLIFYVVGTWVFVSYYLRYAFLAALGVVSLWQLARFARSHTAATSVDLAPPSRRATIARFAIAAGLAWLAILAFAGHMSPGNTVDLTFPLRGGKYCIIQGGGNFATNPFHNFVDAEYAVDIVKINRMGNRASGIAPRDTHAYEIFGETIYSPCDGIVFAVVDTVFDNEPPRANAILPLGNYVMIARDEAQVIVAHLENGSVMVAPGDVVTTGTPIGRVGNSGYSNEPHLHVQARRWDSDDPAKAQPLAITFAGRFVATNDIVHAR